jgi:hypothetical protein
MLRNNPDQIDESPNRAGVRLVPLVAGVALCFLAVFRAPPANAAEPLAGTSNAAPVPSLDQPWENTLGMKFVPVPGTAVLFAVWDTRVQDYRAFADETHIEWPKAGFEQGPTHPAVNVLWEDATAFCAWLTKKEHAAGRLGANQHYRLPTDAEWSIAVGLDEPRDGSPQSKDLRDTTAYPWGTQWPPPPGAGNYEASLNVDKFDHTSPVASFAANKFGLYDMGGNVWQSCDDFYNGSSGNRVLRGGSFSPIYDNLIVLSSCRNLIPGGLRFDNFGFRCVLAGPSSP